MGDKQKHNELCEAETFDTFLRKFKLQDMECKVLRMRYMKSNTFRFIAKELGCSENKVKRTHRKAMRKLKKLL